MRAPVAVVVGGDVVAVSDPPVPAGELIRPEIWTEWPTWGARSVVLFSIHVVGTSPLAALDDPLVPVAPGPAGLVRAFRSS